MAPPDTQRTVRFADQNPTRDLDSARSRPIRIASDRLPSTKDMNGQLPKNPDKSAIRPPPPSHHQSYTNSTSYHNNNTGNLNNGNNNGGISFHGHHQAHHDRAPAYWDRDSRLYSSRDTQSHHNNPSQPYGVPDRRTSSKTIMHNEKDLNTVEDTLTGGVPILSPTSAHHHAANVRGYNRSPSVPEDGRPVRPLGPQRTPSNTYAPNRRPTPNQSLALFHDHHRSGHTRRVRNPQTRNSLVQWKQRNGFVVKKDGDSDSEGETSLTEDNFDSEVVMFYTEDNQEPTEEDYKDPASAERLQWQGMLMTALSGDVIGNEKMRLTRNTKNQNRIPSDELFIALRAGRFRRHISVQKKIISDARKKLGQQLDEIMNFQVKGEDEVDGMSPHDQIIDVFKKIEMCESLYPSINFLKNAHQSAKSESFTEATKAVMTWYNTVKKLETELCVLRLWVGNADLNIERSEDGVAKDASAYIHRLLNDKSLHTLYLNGVNDDDPNLTTEAWETGSSGDDLPAPLRRRQRYSTLEAMEQISESEPMHRLEKARIMGRKRLAPGQDKNSEPGEGGGGILRNLFYTVNQVKRSMIKYADQWKRRHMPVPVEELTTLINFPPRLVQTMLQEQVAIAKVANIKTAAQTNSVILDQMIAQFKTLLRMSVEINQSYRELIIEQENWSIPDTIDDSYQTDVFSALRFYFKMLNWKLSNNKNTFKEAEVLSHEWEFAHSIGGHFKHWETELAEHFSHVTHKALTRLEQTFEREIREKHDESTVAMSKRIKACLDSVRVRQRMLQRFSRKLNINYENCCDYSIPVDYDILEQIFDNLSAGGHVRLQTRFDTAGYVMVVSPAILSEKKLEYVQQMMQLTSQTQIPPENLDALGTSETNIESGADPDNSGPDGISQEATGPAYYVLIFRAEETPIWKGNIVALELEEQQLDIQVGHVRLLAPSSDVRYQQVNSVFQASIDHKLDIVNDRRSNLVKVHTKLTELRRVSYKISNTVMDSVETIRNETRGKGCEELIHTCYMSATEFGQRALQYMDENRRQMNNIKLSKLALDWVTFIDEDCKGADKRTFRWAMQALDFVSAMTSGRQILGLSDPDWIRLRRSVSGCMTMLVQHLDVMGARSSIQAKAEAARKMEVYEKQTRALDLHLKDDEEASELISKARMEAIREREQQWAFNDQKKMGFGRVLQEGDDLDRGLMDISSATNNGTFRWQIGQSLGSGAFGTVYVGVNLSRGQLMAVKEIKLQDPKSMLKIKHQIIREVKLLMALDHPNVVGCFGVEVRRDRVHIFMELCSGGSLAGLLEHGAINDEPALQELSASMLDGLKYLHDHQIVHRDIKPANILLDHAGTVKFVDFGAAKILSKHSANIAAQQNVPGTSSYVPAPSSTDDKAIIPKNPLLSRRKNGTTGTPMYMAPEVIQGFMDHAKASDIWSLGCVILELATGNPPWPTIDNEYAIMFNIGNGLLPTMPSEQQMSDTGRDFLGRLLKPNPDDRATAEELLMHPWITATREDAETPSDSSTGGTPGAAQVGMAGMFPAMDGPGNSVPGVNVTGTSVGGLNVTAGSGVGEK